MAIAKNIAELSLALSLKSRLFMVIRSFFLWINAEVIINTYAIMVIIS